MQPCKFWPGQAGGSVSVKLTVQVSIAGPKDVIGGVQGVLASLLA